MLEALVHMLALALRSLSEGGACLAVASAKEGRFCIVDTRHDR
jgi:hypothetical protein